MIFLHLLTLSTFLGVSIFTGRAAWYAQTRGMRVAGWTLTVLLIGMAAALAVYWWRTA